jgi:hypothetical protein
VMTTDFMLLSLSRMNFFDVFWEGLFLFFHRGYFCRILFNISQNFLFPGSTGDNF